MYEQTLIPVDKREDPRVAEARARLAAARVHTAGALVTLQVEGKEHSHWRTWVHKSPGKAMLIAFVAGFWLGHRR